MWLDTKLFWQCLQVWNLVTCLPGQANTAANEILCTDWSEAMVNMWEHMSWGISSEICEMVHTGQLGSSLLSWSHTVAPTILIQNQLISKSNIWTFVIRLERTQCRSCADCLIVANPISHARKTPKSWSLINLKRKYLPWSSSWWIYVNVVISVGSGFWQML